jgi:hypothetical protein
MPHRQFGTKQEADASKSRAPKNESEQLLLLPAYDEPKTLLDNEPPHEKAKAASNKQLGKKSAAGERKSQTPKPEIEELLLPSHDEAKTLCELALRVKELAPWQWMEETDIFGIEDPDTGELGFISVMGYLGEYESVAVYRGAEGLYGFMPRSFRSGSLCARTGY